MKVSGFRTGESACDFYRCVLPMQTAQRYGAAKYKEVWAEKVVGDLVLDPDNFYKKMDTDIYLVQRLNTIPFLRRIKEYIKEKNAKGRVIVDFDDNVFKVSPLSNHYADYGTENFQITFPDGTTHDAWKDGVNIDLKKNRERLDDVKRIVSGADMITVTTPIIAEVFREYNENVRVLPNCVDLNEWQKLPLEKNEKHIKLYWGGGMSHWEDLLMIRGPLKQIFNKYPNAKIVMLGWMPDGFAETFPGRVEFKEWSNFYAYSYKVASIGIDIALIPLVDNEFNRCKSPIKWIEMSALQIPSVVSYCSPYKEVESLSDKDLAVFIDGNSPDAWVEGISMLIDNPDLRQKIGEEAKMVVEKHFDINTQYPQWVNAYSEALCQSPALPLKPL